MLFVNYKLFTKHGLVLVFQYVNKEGNVDTSQLSMNPRPNITNYHVCIKDGGGKGQTFGCG